MTLWVRYSPEPSQRVSTSSERQRMNLHERISICLGWTVDETKTFSLSTLRELVHPISPKLAYEITLVMRDPVGDYDRPTPSEDT